MPTFDHQLPLTPAPTPGYDCAALEKRHGSRIEQGVSSELQLSPAPLWLKQHGGHARASDGSSSSSSPTPCRYIVYGPNDISGSPDPFDCLPGEASLETWRLLDMYLDAGAIQPAVADLQKQVQNLRRNVWFPMIMESKATFSSFVLFLELDQSVLSDGPSTVHRMNSALQGLNGALINPGEAPIDSLCYGVLLLLITARYTNDVEAMQAHLNGLAALFTHRGGLFAGKDYLARAILAWGFGPLTGNTHPASAIIGWAFHKEKLWASLSDVTMPPFMRPSSNIRLQKPEPFNNKGAGFDNLRNKNLISDSMLVVVPQMRAFNHFLVRAKTSILSVEETTELLRTIWYTGWSLYNMRDKHTNDFDDCCRWGMLLCCYFDMFPNSLSSERQIAALIHQQLMNTHIETLLPDAADALLWLALATGPISDDNAALWFARLLMAASKVLNASSYNEAVQHAERFFWSRTMDPKASVFWRTSFSKRHWKSFQD